MINVDEAQYGDDPQETLRHGKDDDRKGIPRDHQGPKIGGKIPEVRKSRTF